MKTVEYFIVAINLYVVRHGEAEPIQSDDASRALTEHGRWEAKRTALWLKTQTSQFALAFSSPYVRAEQTRDIVFKYGPKAKYIEVTADLIPEGDAKTITDYILAMLPDDDESIDILVVSHMPLVSFIIGELTQYTPIMATAGVAQIEIDKTNWRGHLRTLLAPEQML